MIAVYTKNKALAYKLSVAFYKSKKGNESVEDQAAFGWYSNKLGDTYLLVEDADAFEVGVTNGQLLKDVINDLILEGLATSGEALEVASVLDAKEIVTVGELIPDGLYTSAKSFEWLIQNNYRAQSREDFGAPAPLTTAQIAARRIALGSQIVQSSMIEIAAINDELQLSAEAANGALAQFSNLISLLNAGALNTSRMIILSIYDSAPIYQPVFDNALLKIAAFEALYGL